MGSRGEPVKIGQRVVLLTRPEKILFPDGITKGELIKYYHDIAPHMLPHIEDRPLSLQRWPDGIDRPGFFQKSVADYYPSWIKRVTVKKAGGTVTHAICSDAATLVYLANQACITPHIWLSRTPKLLYPDQMVFDLDPSGDTFGWVKAAARSVRALLDELGLAAYVKTTGSRGLHVVVPLKPRHSYGDVYRFATTLASLVVQQEPRQRTLEFSKSKRGGRVFIDTNRNAYAQTVAPAFAVRARAGAPVSVPIEWDELDRKGLRSDGWTIRTVFDRLAKTQDPWKDFGRRRTSLKAAAAKL